MPSLMPTGPIHSETNFELPKLMDLPESFIPGEILYRVHIRIDTPLYRLKGRPCFENSADREASGQDLVNVAERAGMVSQKGGFFVDQLENPKESLHLHPDDLSGVFSWDRLQRLLAALEDSKYSSLRWIDVFDPFEIITEEEGAKRIAYYEQDIAEEVLRMCTTTRKHKFRALHMAAFTGRAYPGLCLREGDSHRSIKSAVPESVSKGLNAIRDQLVAQGRLITFTKDGFTYYRTANKTELRKAGLLKTKPTVQAMPEEQAALAF